MSDYTKEKKPGMTIVGIACRTSNAPDKAPVDIPAHWERFFKENILDKIPNKASQEIIGLYCDYEGDHTKPYTLVIGCPVTKVETLPDGMVAKNVPEALYAAFNAVGKHPQSLIDTWGKIWQTELPRTYTGDLEVYGKKFSSDPQEVEVFIAIKES